MDKAIDMLEGMFHKTEKDIDFMSRKLEHQLGNLDGVDQKANPVKLIKKMENIKDDYANIKKDVLAVQEAQKEMSDYFRSEMLTLIHMLGKLEGNTGQSPEQDEDTKAVFDEVFSRLGIPPGELLESQASSAGGTTAEAAESCTGGSDPSCPSGSSSSETVTSTGSSSSHGGKKKAVTNTKQKRVEQSKPEDTVTVTNEMKRKNGEYIEISDQEFRSVSKLLTDRLKVGDINKVYERLWQHFKEEKSMGKLSPKDMNGMGLRVTGATGENKLKVLRALKLCQISKTGDVTLL